jgi:hypothetical protein
MRRHSTLSMPLCGLRSTRNLSKHYYVDANPLLCSADAQIATPAAYDTKVAGVVVALVEGASTTAISEITLLEVHSNICDHWRDTGRPEHDDPWADRALGQLMAWLGDGLLEVLPQPPKLPEMAMVNVEEITRRARIRLRAWDAAHLLHAVSWSRQLGEQVTFVTADRDFEKVLDSLPEFRPHVELLDPGA